MPRRSVGAVSILLLTMAGSPAGAQTVGTTLEIEDVYGSVARVDYFGTPPPELIWAGDDDYVRVRTGSAGRQWMRVDAVTGRETPLFDPADLVAALRQAGAVILGKTNLSEWANFRSTRSSSGWSGRGLQTKNPYALDRNPSGSSSGTGTSISANLATVGIGTETDGSIVSPSNANGLVGFKPTVGLVSRRGIIPISHTQDTPGQIGRAHV